MASSSSSSHSVQASSSRSWKYDVFLSFRGEDTRNTFVSHLYSALEQQGICTYKDDETLPRGQSIHPSLIRAIEESQIAVIVFSKNYGDSSWCLDELTHIMKCKDSRGQIAMPIFYDVDPSEVRKQKRKYAEVFARHELENKTKVESWRKALTDASSISGWEPSKVANGDESKCIKEIVAEISQKLHIVNPRANENLIGMAARLKGLRSELQTGSSGVRMIGIWGVWGGGKTTLASSVYDEICWQFDGCCFIQNVREESSRHGLGKLEEDILSKLGVNRVGGGRSLISNRLRQRKVLIVLDDVDHLDQLDALAGSHDWFGEGSRVIITTRDQHLLCRVNVIYNISLLNDHEAMELFCKHAPCGHKRVEDYELLAKAVVSYAGGLPLALKVLGCFLCDKDMDTWRSALARLKTIPDANILEKLKISYEGLQRDEKQLFLDIACFYRMGEQKSAMKKLDACGFHPVIGVKVLIQKALITILHDEDDNTEVFDMHDLVQEMGHHIVRGEHPNSPEKHSRLWKDEDFLKLCAIDATTELDMIEAIIFESDWASSVDCDCLSEIVAKMKNLRLLIWKGDLESPLPTNFSPMKLCFLRVYDCFLNPLWEGYKLLPNLKIMELCDVRNLIRAPEFDGIPNLERLRVKECRYLEEIHPSVGHLKRLVSLSIENCERLKMFPPITGLKTLETLSFSGCRQLFKPSEIRQQNMNHLGLRLSLKHLRDLNLSRCNLGDEELGSAVWQLPNLITLDLSGNDFSRLDFSLLRVPRLKHLNVMSCTELVQLSELLGLWSLDWARFHELPTSIAVILAHGCDSLESFGDISNCKWLWKVSLKFWKNKVNKHMVDGDMLLDSMLQGKASEYYFIQFILANKIPKRFVGRLFRGQLFTLRLPDDWYNDFSGFLICSVAYSYSHPDVDIVIKQEIDEDFLLEVCRDSNELVEPENDDYRQTYVGYVSFDSLSHTAFSISSYTKISVEIKDKYIHLEGYNYNRRYYIGVELVPRKSKGHQPQTPNVIKDTSEFWDTGDHNYGPQTFTIQDHSKSSLKILWRPY